MLRRLSTLLVCVILIALFAQTVEAQYTVNIGDPDHVGVNGVDPGNSQIYHYDTLEYFWANSGLVYILENTVSSANFVLYADQVIQGNHDNTFYSFAAAYTNARTISLTTANGQDFSISGDSSILYGFFRSTTSNTDLFIAPEITISAGSGDYRNATTIASGADLTAAGVTYIGGGPVVVDYNYGSVNRSGTSYDVHSAVNLQGTSFINSTSNINSAGAVVFLKDVASGVDLQNSTFLNNDSTGLRVQIDDGHYRTANIGISVLLGATDGEQTIFSGNNSTTLIPNPLYDRNDPDSPEYLYGQGSALVVSGRNSIGTTQPTITLNLSSSGTGEVLMLDNMYGEASSESGGSYRTRINMASGTLYLGQGTTHQFNGTSLGTLGTGNRSNVWTHSGGTMVMAKDSRIELTTNFDQFIFNGGTIILEGSTDPNDSNKGNYIEAYTIDFTSRPTFQISGTVLNELAGTGNAVLTLNASVLTQPTNGSLIYFDIIGIRGDIDRQLLVTNLGTDTFKNMQGTTPSGSPHYGQTYRALIEGNDVQANNTYRIQSYITGQGTNSLYLTVNLTNEIVTAVPLSGSTTINWDVASSVSWKYETDGNGHATNNEMHYTAFVPNDAVVFSDFSATGLTFNIMESGVYISQQVGYLSQLTPEDPSLDPGSYKFRQEKLVEYGLRVSGVYDWNLNGGSINDDFDPLMTYHKEQKEHVARLTFEGVGTLNMFNSDPNVYHDGTVLGTRGFDRDSLTAGGYFDSMDGSVKGKFAAEFKIDEHTVTNVYGPGSLGSGKYAGEIALVDTTMNGVKDDEYVVQGDGFGLKFIGYGGKVNIRNNTDYNALETDTLFDQRIRVVQNNDGTPFGGQDTRIVDKMPDPNDSSTWTYRDDISTQGIINMEEGRVDSKGELIHVFVTASDSYWVNHGNLSGENIDNNGETVNTLNSGGTIFIDPNTYFEMTGHFDFTDNRILRSYEGIPITTLDVTRFDGGVLWAGYGASVNMTGTSFTGNGYFYDRTYDAANESYVYTANGHVRHGGAIYFTGGENQFNGEIATLTLSAGSDGKTNVARNIADVGGAIYVSQGAGAVINVQNVIFTHNQATLAGSTADDVGGGAIFIKNNLVSSPVILNASGSEYHNNIAYDAPGGAIRLFEGNTVDLDGSTFRFNGAVKKTQMVQDPEYPDDPSKTIEVEIDEIDQIVTTFGGAIYINHTSSISARAAQFVSNAAQGDGGAVFMTGGPTEEQSDFFTFADAIFRGNIAEGSLLGTGYGGAIYSEYTNLSGIRATFESNKATLDGGAVYVDSFANVTVSADGYQADFANSVFDANSAGGSGGALYFRTDDFTLNIASAQFSNNTTGATTARGGAIYAGGENVIIYGNNAVFARNMIGEDRTGKGQYGGALFLGNNASVFMNNAQFRYNEVTHSQGEGGAVYTGTGANLDFTSSPFRGNVASQRGGAIFTANDTLSEGTLTINSASFSENISKSASGGAIYARNMVVTGIAASFDQNKAGTSGGALHLVSDHVGEHDTKTITLDNASFDLNKAENGVGGAIFIDFDYAVLDADESQFLSNQASGDGGAIYATSNTTLNVNNAHFGISQRDATHGNESLTGSGGAIYLNGKVGDVLETTSELNATGAFFIGNIADVDGGAVYLLYADANITGATFTDNLAGNGRGGALFYENENGKELVVETATFARNIATTGGAVYTVNETFIHAKNTSLSDNKATTGDGGAIYFASDNSQLDISRSATSNAIIERNTAAGDGGAIRMQKDSKLIANDAVFFNNTADDSGGAFRIDGDTENGSIAEVQAGRASFSNNAALNGNGGAIYLFDDSVPTYGASPNLLILNGSHFSNNYAGRDGGAIHAANTDVNIASSNFDRNTAVGDGGALYLQDSDLNAWGAVFTNNKAGAAGKGGAIYYLTTNNHDRSIYLGAGSGQTALFDGNIMQNNVANSIYFETSLAATSYINLDVSTEANGVLNMRDPMAVDALGNNLDLDISKTGVGTWQLGGNNDFSGTRTGTTVDIREGTFTLLPGGTLKLTNVYDDKDYFQLHNGASFATGGDSNSIGSARLEATNLNFDVNTTMTLNTKLILNVSNDYSIGSVLSGNGSFVKEDYSKLTFYGATDNYNGDVSIQGGGFSIAKHNDVPESGRFETTYGTFYMAPGTDLYLIADPEQYTLVAESATIDKVNIHVSGITGAFGEEFILIHTTEGITGDFANVNADGTMSSNVDYLTFDLKFLNNNKDYGGTIGLRWYSTANNIPAWGKFTLVNESDYFNVAVQLTDNNTNLYTGDPSQPGYDPSWPYRWDGNTLDKFGLGTLELSAANTYTGQTTVHEGELYVTNATGTGVGSEIVEVKNDARLGLNFTGRYEKLVKGDGKIVVRGGVVELVADNEYTGGTDLVGGVLEFMKKENLGTGTITFNGGTLRNKAEASLDQAIVIANGKTAKFDVPLYNAAGSRPSLTIEGDISGNGGLEKTGKGILALAGNNTFTETSYIREGGVKIDGSVAGDVRVSQYASVGGTGTIGGDLFISSGGYYDWFYTPDRDASQPLHVEGSVNLATGAIFRPRTDDTDFEESIIGWTVLSYGGSLNGTFTSIDDSFNAYYSFELDYSTPGEVRIAGNLLSSPRALGDAVATSLAITNKKIYRQSFAQLSRETAYCKSHGTYGAVRGQSFEPTRSIWFTPIARVNNFGSTYVGGTYDFEAYGTQVGATLWSNRNNTLGMVFGYERGNLRNKLDQIRSHDYYLGLYYGHLLDDGYEFRAFLGGGFQEYTMFRNDTAHNYKTSYDGGSFEMNFEFGKLFAGQNGTLLRPYIATDIEYGDISSAQENAVGNAYRNYQRADLSQWFIRFGLDLEKRWQYVDWNGGLSYSCLIAGDRRAEAGIFYPVRGLGTTSYSARLGRSSMMLKTGLNWHLDRYRASTFFIDYSADVYMDRAGDGVQHTANMGYQIRF